MKIVVVGGVAAGASLAARARRLDEQAEIIVLERGHHVSFANCGLPYHIGEVIADRSRLLLQTPESLRESLDIDVRVGNDVIAIDRKKRTVTVRELATGREYTESYDALALCGSANLDGRSLFVNFELMTAFYGMREIGWLDAWIGQRVRQSSAYEARTPSWARDVLEGVVRAVGFQL